MTALLPSFPSPLIGRRAEQTALLELLKSSKRVISLISMGGMGKTRLATAAAHECQKAKLFQDGVYFVSCETCKTADDLIAVILQELEYVVQPQELPRNQLINYLRPHHLLLVLDNLEQMISEAAGVISTLITAAPDLTLLITSRERLKLSSEIVFTLQGLADDGLQLFEQTAQRVQPDFQLTELNQELVAAICQQLGGLPLGIMMAAAWINVLSLEEISQEISLNLHFLQADWQDIPSRHYQLTEVLNAVWEHLGETERDSFSAFSVFRGGFTRRAAEAITPLTSLTLRNLSTKALLWRDALRGRYFQHDLLRQYGAEQLRVRGQETEVLKTYAHYFAGIVAAQNHDLKQSQQPLAVQILSADWENIRAAWDWLVDQQNEATLHAMLEPLYLYLVLNNQWYMGEGMMYEAYQRLLSAHASDLLQLRTAVRWLHLQFLGRRPQELEIHHLLQAKRLLEQHIQLCLAENEGAELAFGHYVLGHLLSEMGKTASALEHLEKSLALYEALEDRYFQGLVLHLLGFITIGLEQWEQSLAYSRCSLEMMRSLGSSLNLVGTLANLGSVLMWQEQYREAAVCFEEMLALGKQHDNWWHILLAEQCLGSLAFRQGDMALTRTMAHQVIQRASAYGYRTGIELGTVNLCYAYLALTDYHAAWQLYYQTELPPVVKANGLATAELGLGDYRAAREHLCFVLAEGDLKHQMIALRSAACLLMEAGEFHQATQLLSLTTHNAYNISIFTERFPLFSNLKRYLQSKLSYSSFSAHWEQGKSLDPSQVVAQIRRYLNQEPRDDKNVAQGFEPLSAREQEILLLVSKGLSNRAIADQLVVEISTVKKHLTHVYEKLGVSNRVQALIQAREQRLL
jgi:predicted ATPase/DNA-binding CsgD family transcriptional regulator